ncbi:hypothetical protein [Brevundimonas sp.]|uniref:hypothetical protein n=1 Tax=Brevundimonas sp. TaxID=1871086 RepID=UPI001DBE050E|nr:hypothetical protein [Brevundimonas sp.]MBL0946572.1 hypothetical protein [Brevundimonas sp.]
MTEHKGWWGWLAACFLVGVVSSVVGAIWLLAVDGLLLPERVTLGSSLGVAFGLPVLFAMMWPGRSGTRLEGGAFGGVGSGLGLFALAMLVEMMHQAG